jgi:HEAT repeat protein
MKRLSKIVTCVLLALCSLAASAAQGDTDVDSPQHRAWDMLQTAAGSKRVSDRTNGIRALGLLPDDIRGRTLAEYALKDSNFEVRAAAATALGQMHATESIPRLQNALQDRKMAVVLAAAHSLRELKDSASAYAVYYELLTRERKSSEGLIAQQVDVLKDPKQLAKIGFSEGIGYVPFAGIGWDAWQTIHKKNSNPVRAIAASLLARDPDPATARALVRATHDRNWIVRAAALEAIAQRGDPSLLRKVELCFADRNSKVRDTAAAAVIRLSSIQKKKFSKETTSEKGHE